LPAADIFSSALPMSVQRRRRRAISIVLPSALRSARYQDEKRKDEVFFRLNLTADDDGFERFFVAMPRRSILASTSSGNAKDNLRAQGTGFLRDLVKWLQEHMTTAFEVTYQGKARPLLGWVKGKLVAAAPDQRPRCVNTVGSVCLAPHFEDMRPITRVLTPHHDRQPRVGDPGCIESHRRRPRTKLGTAVLEALELLDGERLDRRSQSSPPGRRHAEEEGHGQVVNRSNWFTKCTASNTSRLTTSAGARVAGGPAFPLVHSGDLVLAIPGKKLDQTNIAH